MKRATFARILRPIRTRFPETLRLLDCGAATGYLMEEAAALGMDPYGAELSEFGASRIAENFIEHVRAPISVLAKASRLLRPGGRLVILTPNADSLSRRLMGLRWLHYKVEHLYYFGPRSLTRALRQVGLTEVRVGRAWKMLNLHYLVHQFAQYPHPLLSPIVSMAHRLSPSSLRKGMFPISFGELLATASKPPIGQGGQ